MIPAPLASSRAFWNRTEPSIESDEALTQLLDRGEMTAWRALYRLAQADPVLRARIKHIVRTVPVPLPRFWLAALAALGESVDFDAPVPDYYEQSSI